MDVGYVLPNSWGMASPADVVALGVLAEEAGAATLWVSHHVLHVGFVGDRLGDRPYHDPIITLAAVASATTRARLGTSVLVAPYLHPMTTAKALATVDAMSDGRVDVGLGAGGLRVEHDAIGLVPWSQRGRWTDEFIDVVRLLWSGQRSSFHGEFFSFDDVAAHPGPARPGGLPVLVGGVGEAALRRCATRGDGWHGIGLEPDVLPDHRAALADALAAAGRLVERFPVQVRLHIPADDLDTGAWLERAAAYVDAGVTQLVLAPQSGEADAHRRWFEAVLAPLATSYPPDEPPQGTLEHRSDA